jgi:PAS domain S-box-containing protein
MDDNRKTKEQLIEELQGLRGQILEQERLEADRRRTEEPLRESEEKFHSLYNNSLDGIIFGAPDGSILAANPAACTILGWSEQELCMGRRDLLLDKNDPRVKQIIKEREKTGRFRGEVRCRKKNGAFIPVEVGTTQFTLSTGEKRTQIILRDITKQKKAETALKESEERFRLLAEVIEEVFWMADPGIEKMIYISPGYEKVWGRSRKSLYKNPKSFIEFVHPEDRDRVAAVTLRENKDEPFKIEYRIVRPDGSIRWIWDRGFPVRSEGGLVSYFVGVATDITDRTRVEEALKASEKSLRLLSTRLINAQENERKRIAYELHDDLGQSLVGLKIQLSRLKKKSSGTSPKLTQGITQALNAIDEITEDVRRLSRELRPSVLEHLGLMDALQWLFEDFSKKYGIIISNSISQLNETFAKEQEIIIFRIFQEGLANIGRHSDATQVTIAMSQARNTIGFSITDNGKGFNLEEIRKRKPSKIGLGLIAMNERATMAGGSLEIKSQVGKGTSICFSIRKGRSRKRREVS